MEKQKYYFVYEITNKINGKTYIGCHETYNIDDCYMGSGKLIKKAISKYGIENFKKVILSYHGTRDEMFLKERNIIDAKKPQYNLNIGGRGGFHYINSQKLNLYPEKRDAAYAKLSHTLRDKYLKQYNSNPRKCLQCHEELTYNKRMNVYCSSSCSAKSTNRGRKHSTQTRNKISSALRYERKKCIVCDTELSLKNRSQFCRQHLSKNKKLSYKEKEEIKHLRKSMTLREIANIYGVSYVTIYNITK